MSSRRPLLGVARANTEQACDHMRDGAADSSHLHGLYVFGLGTFCTVPFRE